MISHSMSFYNEHQEDAANHAVTSKQHVHIRTNGQSVICPPPNLDLHLRNSFTIEQHMVQ